MRGDLYNRSMKLIAFCQCIEGRTKKHRLSMQKVGLHQHAILPFAYESDVESGTFV